MDDWMGFIESKLNEKLIKIDSFCRVVANQGQKCCFYKK